MSDRGRVVDHYRAEFRRLLDRGAASPDGLLEIRRRAFDQFAATGFPTTRAEEWKYTNVEPVARIPFRRAADLEATPFSAAHALVLEKRLLAEHDSIRLVFLDGRYVPALSRVAGLPEGVRILPLSEALRAGDPAVREHAGRIAETENAPFAALNTAFFEEGALVAVPPRAAVAAPVFVVHISTPRSEGIVTHPRILVDAAEGSQLTIVEGYAAAWDGGPYLTNAVTEIRVGPGAVVLHHKLQRESEAAFHVATVQALQERQGAFTCHNVSIGGALVRNDVRSRLAGEGADCTLNGLFIADGRQHVDNHTLVDHATPHGSSRELYKGVLAGAATAVFNGKVVVRPDAQKTDARQVNRNLLLSPDAVIDTKPELEIFANDVKCTHGATIGQLDEEALFYLRSRGIPREAARNVLTWAFASEIVEALQAAPLREGLGHLLVERFHARGAEEVL